MESSVSGNAASERYYTVFQQGWHLKFAGHSFYGSSNLEHNYAESQDLAKRIFICCLTEICPL